MADEMKWKNLAGLFHLSKKVQGIRGMMMAYICFRVSCEVRVRVRVSHSEQPAFKLRAWVCNAAVHTK